MKHLITQYSIVKCMELVKIIRNRRKKADHYGLDINTIYNVFTFGIPTYLLTDSHVDRSLRICWDYSSSNSILIRPSIITQLALPRPENPSHCRALIRLDLCSKPIFVKCLLGAGIPACSPLNIIWDRKTELANDGGRITTAIVSAGSREIKSLRWVS